MNLPAFLGMVGVAIIAGSYMLVQSQRISANTMSYPLANFIGAGLILFSLMYDWNTPSVCIEAIWMLISLFGVLKNLRDKSKQIQISV
jgi:paired small multidrug resistance pump